jgi:hypothetical protein
MTVGVTNAVGNIRFAISWLSRSTLKWSSWQSFSTDFHSGPALAATSQRELSLYGNGTDGRILVTTQIPNGSFSPIGPRVLGGNPSAVGIGSTVYLGALSNGVPQTSKDETYSYTTRVFDNSTAAGPIGDWGYGEYRGFCDSTRWPTGVSAATGSGRAHSFLCASAGGTADFYSPYRLLDISTANDGYGNHPLGYDWDYGYYKGECAADELVSGLTQAPSGGALKHVRCTPALGPGTNCRELKFGTSDNRESFGSSGDWAPGYYKVECRKGSAIAGVSRSVSTGAVHAVLCCDFPGL